jgi:hypothetical protein
MHGKSVLSSDVDKGYVRDYGSFEIKFVSLSELVNALSQKLNR